MSSPQNTIQVAHGKLVVNVPRDIFVGSDAVIDEKKANEFRSILSSRYPWLKETSLDVLMRHAREQMLTTIDDETGGREVSRKLDERGETGAAIAHLRAYLEKNPQDGRSWYALGELLCKAGHTDEGFKAISRGSSLMEK
jgi:tetratricopeptide (TPR) repeat protein